jgi:hypothetical protein
VVGPRQTNTHVRKKNALKVREPVTTHHRAMSMPRDRTRDTALTPNADEHGALRILSRSAEPLSVIAGRLSVIAGDGVFPLDVAAVAHRRLRRRARSSTMACSCKVNSVRQSLHPYV